jgi:hypothetical protein
LLANNFDETITLTAGQLELPFFRRQEFHFEKLKNHSSVDKHQTADGFLVNLYCTELDFLSGGVAAFVISRFELLVKVPTVPNHYMNGTYSGTFFLPYGTAHTYLIDRSAADGRRWYYRLIKLPSSHPIENLFAENPTSFKVEPALTWIKAPGSGEANAISVLQWPVAFSRTVSRWQNIPEEMESFKFRAAREARERAMNPDNHFRSNPPHL